MVMTWETYGKMWATLYDKALSENDWIYSKYLQFQLGKLSF